MTKYADLAKTVTTFLLAVSCNADGQIFGTCKAGVSILTDEHEHVYYIDVSLDATQFTRPYDAG
jgi:hypothetical protein